MHDQVERQIQCPWCWECITLLIDPSVAEQEYVEDCRVCCRPILLTVQCHGDTPDIRAEREND